MNVQVDVNTLVDYMVQLYYARRVYIVGESIIIQSSSPLAFVFTARAAALKFWSRYTSLVPVTCIGLGSGVVADILIAASMCWFLYHKKTGFARRVQFSPFTPQMWLSFREQNRFHALDLDDLQYPVRFTDKFATASSSMYWQLFFWPMGKFYANSLLAMLNSRDYVRERSSADDKLENTFGLSSIQIERNESDKSRRPAVSVAVHRSTTTDFPQGKRDHDVESSTVENSKGGEYSL
ncbi:hypothetical protein EDB83DRAFT_2533898 [Lactarius deliciosus]|nr:hypothetical protein EDB83DRAFT_2533898 [Lactarius deliciosus]